MNIIDTYDLYKTRREIKKNAYAIMRLYISTIISKIIIIMVIGRWHTSKLDRWHAATHKHQYKTIKRL